MQPTNYPFYEFICCKMPLEELIKRLPINSFFEKFRKRTCLFRCCLIKEVIRQNLNGNIPRMKAVKLFFAPKIAPDKTICVFEGKYMWHAWLGSVDSSMEIMSLRFTSPDKKSDVIRELSYYCGNKLIRAIRVMTDPQWKLWLAGEQQPFEEGKSYEKVKGKRIKDYFTHEDMIRFATNWGCPIDQDDFWASDKPMYCWGELENEDKLDVDWTEFPNGF